MNARIGSEVGLGSRTGPLDLLLDQQWLSDLVGQKVLAQRIRHKPGVGTVASYGPASGPACGWVQLVARSAQDKIVNAERRAAQRDRAVIVRPLTPGWTAMHGVLTSDPRLHQALDQVPTELVEGLERGERVQLLRYNPHRRLVLRCDDIVLRLTTNRQTHVVAGAQALAAAGICVSQPVRVPGVTAGKRVTAWPWVKGTDLLAKPCSREAVVAGESLARWHAQPARLTPAALRSLSPKTGLQAVLDELDELDPSLAAQVRPVAADLVVRISLEGIGNASLWSHGDFSADQVISHPNDGVCFIDLDRSILAPPGADLGSFCAVEVLREQEGAPAAELSASLLGGYADAGGTVPGPDSLRDWTAYWLISRLTEPLRHAQPTWRFGILQRWAQIQEMLRS